VSFGVLALGFFLATLDTSIVTIAIPAITEDFNSPLSTVLWVVNAYTLTITVMLIPAGRLGDRYGTRRVFAAGVAVFTAASMLCGLADGPVWLIIARTVQGLGAALMLPQTMAAVVALFPVERRGLALGIWGTVGGVAAIAGPPLGGLLVAGWGWRWVFVVNVPVGVLALVLTRLAVPDLRPVRRERGGAIGMALAAALLCVTFPLLQGPQLDWPLWVFAVPVVTGCLAAGYLRHLRHKRGRGASVADELPRDGAFTAMVFAAATTSVLTSGLVLVLTLQFQTVVGADALHAGLLLAPPALVSATLAPFTGRLAERHGVRRVLLSGYAFTAAGLGWMVPLMHRGMSLPSFLPPPLLIGAGNGLLVATTAASALRHVPLARAGIASGLINTFRQLGAVLGVALVGLLLQARHSHPNPGHDVLIGMTVPGAATLGGAVASGMCRAERSRRT
jgi:EmrB/QacA subfamily drug resistance transporter